MRRIFSMSWLLNCTIRVESEQEDNAKKCLEFILSVNLQRIFNVMKKGLINHVLETFDHVVGTSNGKSTSAEGKHLAKHVHNEPTLVNSSRAVLAKFTCILMDTLSVVLFILSNLPVIHHFQSLCINTPWSKLVSIYL